MRTTKNVKWFIALMFSFLMLFLVKNEQIKAIEYEYIAGKVEEKHKDVKVMEFDYDYITKFSNEAIVDKGINVSNQSFYSAKSITINYDHYSHWWPLTKDSDGTYIYEYNNTRNDFDTSIKIFKDESGNYTLNEEGLYKVVYAFEDEEIFVRYINIEADMHDAFVRGDAKYQNTSAFAEFKFNLKLQDGYDLRNNKYYYAFGTNVANLKFTEFNVFTEAEKEGMAVNKVDRDLTVAIKDSDTSVNGAKKYFFIKIVTADNKEKLIQTVDSYELSSKIEASVYLINDNDEIVTQQVSYKRFDIIRFKVVFNAPVTYTNLQFAVDGSTYMILDDKNEEVSEIIVEYVVQGYENFAGSFKLLTKNNVAAVVKNAGVNVSLNVITKDLKFNIDVVAPEISVLEDGDLNGKNKYAVTINVEEDNIKEVVYYAAKCVVSQEDRCLDKFDNDNENIISLGAATNPTAIIDKTFGLFNGDNVALFVKAVDKAGNEKTFVKWGYILDNVIVPKGNENSMFAIYEIVENEVVKGKQLVVNVPFEYEVGTVSYKASGGSEVSCEYEVMSAPGVATFNCLTVEGYDFNSKIEVLLADIYGNIESHSTEFRYSTIKDGNIILGGKNFELHSDKEFEIEFKMYNLMKNDEAPLVFNQEILDGFKAELNFDKLPSMKDLLISLVYMDKDNLVVIKENITNELSVPSILELLETLGHLEAFKKCAIDKCNVELYLKYDYIMGDVPQTRLVKINFIDHSNKYVAENFSYDNKVNVGSEFVEYSYKYLSNLNVEIAAKDVVITKKIMFEDKNGAINEVTSINTRVLGKYTVVESYAYNGANSFPLTYVVEVVDELAPVIRLNGKDKITITVGEKFIDPFAVANDNYDGTVTVKYKVDPELDVNKKGTYIISYWAEDSSGNISEIVTRTVVVKGESELMTYLIAGGIGLFTILVMVVTTIIEVKKEKRKA